MFKNNLGVILYSSHLGARTLCKNVIGFLCGQTMCRVYVIVHRPSEITHSCCTEFGVSNLRGKETILPCNNNNNQVIKDHKHRLSSHRPYIVLQVLLFVREILNFLNPQL